MLRSLSERLSQAVARVTGRGRITEDNIRDTVRQIRLALLEADVALPVAKAFIERVRVRALGEEVAEFLGRNRYDRMVVEAARHFRERTRSPALS